MTREIKFRAWDKKKKQFVDMEYMYIDCDGVLCDQIWEDLEPNENYILMQYTGLKDKDGKEIYEGDIIEHRSHLVEDTGIYRVEFGNGSFQLCSDSKLSFEVGFTNVLNLKIIGNICENPEMLNNKMEVEDDIN